MTDTLHQHYVQICLGICCFKQPIAFRFLIRPDLNLCLLPLTERSGPAFVGVVRKDWSSGNSVALSWSEVEQLPSDIVDYEVKYYEKVK